MCSGAALPLSRFSPVPRLGETVNRREESIQNVHKKQLLEHLFTLTLYIAKKLPKSVNIKGVFAANELDLDEVSIYGFDYDYT